MRSASLLLLASLSLLGATCDPPVGETWIIAGQSNADGRGRDWSMPHPLPLPDGRDALAFARGDVHPLLDEVGNPGGWQRSPWPSFAAARILGGAPQPYTVHAGVGSTCLVFADPEDPTQPSWAPGGASYQRMLDLVAGARARGFPPAAAVLWDQGGCEATKDPRPPAELEAAYLAGFLDLVERIQVDLGPLPVVAALISAEQARLAARPAEAERFAAVRAALMAAAAFHPMVRLGPEQAAEDFTWEDDGIHVRSVDVSGLAWADAVNAAFTE